MADIFYVKAGWLIDGAGEKAKHDVVLSIRNGRIVSIEKDSFKEAHDGASFDLTGHTIIPGLIDSHVHLAFDGNTIAAQKISTQYEDAKKRIKHNLEQLFSCGIIAVRDGGDPNAFVQRYNEEIGAEEDLPCKVCTPGHAWFRTGRYGSFIGSGIIDERNLVVQVQKEISKIDHVKIINSGLNSLTEFKKETPSQFSQPALRAVCDAAKASGIPVMVHANGRKAVANALAAGCQTIEHGYFMGRDNLKKMADDQVTWVPTVTPIKYFTEVSIPDSIEADVAQRTLDDQLEQLYLARKYGVPVSVGTDAGCPGVVHGQSFSNELKLFSDAGYRIEEIIQCATQMSANVMCLPPVTIQTNMAATFLAVEASPDDLLNHLDALSMIYINGQNILS